MIRRDDEFEILGNLFARVAERYENIEESHLDNQIMKHLTIADMRAVHRLGELRRERMTNLANHLRLTVGTLTTTIDRLVKKGYVLRTRIEEDRRVVEVSLSEEGSLAYNQISLAKTAAAQRMFSRLTDEERTRLREILHKLSRED